MIHPLSFRASEGIERTSGAKLRLAAASNELLRLGEELDLADASGAELDVVPGKRDAAETAKSVDLPLHGMDVGNGREIEVSPPDEGRDLVEELLAGLDVASHRARLDERGPLPVLTEAFVIDGGGFSGERNLRRAGIGPKPQVGAEDVAVLRPLLHQLDELAGDAHKEGLRLEAELHPLSLEVEKDDDIDVARIVELVGAVFANTEHEISRAPEGIGRIDRLPVAFLCSLPEEKIESRTQRGVRRFSEHMRHLHDRPDAREIGKCGDERDLSLVDAERLHDIGFGRCRRGPSRPALSGSRLRVPQAR